MYEFEPTEEIKEEGTYLLNRQKMEAPSEKLRRFREELDSLEAELKILEKEDVANKY